MATQLHCGKYLPAALFFLAMISGGINLQLYAQPAGPTPLDATAKVPAYEVVSIRPANPNDPNGVWRNLPNGFDFSNAPIFWLIYQAYGVTMSSQISRLPEWVKTDHYFVSARANEETVEAWKSLSSQDRWKQQQLMLQALLADRFHLQVRREVKDLPVYDLVIAKSGLKMKEAAPEEKDIIDVKTDSATDTASGAVEYTKTMTARAVSAASLAHYLPHDAGRIILDKTGLGEKKFDFELKWSSNQEAPADSGGTGPSLFKALEEQLGLKLEPAKEPVDTFVVDHIERPSAN